jgi:crystallin alpha B
MILRCRNVLRGHSRIFHRICINRHGESAFTLQPSCLRIAKMALWTLTDPFATSRPLDRHVGFHLDPEDFAFHNFLRYPGYLRSWRSAASRQDSGSSVSFGKDKFEANLDVQQFKPEEITVKVSDNTVTVEGKHDERVDEHGYISRHFVRRYVLAEGHDGGRIESKLSSDGVLTITAPKNESGEEKMIPIVQTGRSSREVEQQQSEGEKEE